MAISEILLIMSVIIAGVIYWVVKCFESAAKKNIMIYVILLLLIILIALYTFMSLSKYDGCVGIIYIIFILAIDLLLVIFLLIEKLYKKLRKIFNNSSRKL